MLAYSWLRHYGSSKNGSATFHGPIVGKEIR
jgi:hypothetical protein